MSVTTESAAQSILGWTPQELKEEFNRGGHPWTASRTEQIDSAPNSPEEVKEYLGEELSERSYQLVIKLKELDADAKLGFVTGHNPCF